MNPNSFHAFLSFWRSLLLFYVMYIPKTKVKMDIHAQANRPGTIGLKLSADPIINEGTAMMPVPPINAIQFPALKSMSWYFLRRFSKYANLSFDGASFKSLSLMVTPAWFWYQLSRTWRELRLIIFANSTIASFKRPFLQKFGSILAWEVNFMNNWFNRLLHRVNSSLFPSEASTPTRASRLSRFSLASCNNGMLVTY
jgi:hypothetical protein